MGLLCNGPLEVAEETPRCAAELLGFGMRSTCAHRDFCETLKRRKLLLQSSSCPSSLQARGQGGFQLWGVCSPGGLEIGRERWDRELWMNQSRGRSCCEFAASLWCFRSFSHPFTGGREGQTSLLKGSVISIMFVQSCQDFGSRAPKGRAPSACAVPVLNQCLLGAGEERGVWLACAGALLVSSFLISSILQP